MKLNKNENEQVTNTTENRFTCKRNYVAEYEEQHGDFRDEVNQQHFHGYKKMVQVNKDFFRLFLCPDSSYFTWSPDMRKSKLKLC